MKFMLCMVLLGSIGCISRAFSLAGYKGAGLGQQLSLNKGVKGHGLDFSGGVHNVGKLGSRGGLQLEMCSKYFSKNDECSFALLSEYFKMKFLSYYRSIR